jgi:hypothetical protein
MEGDHINLKQYLEQYNLTHYYDKARKYLPLPDPETVIVSAIPKIEKETILGSVWKEYDIWYIYFRNNPPDAYTLFHELIHLAGGTELPAYNYTSILIYCIENNVEPFNLLDLLHVKLSDIINILKKHGFTSLTEYYTFRGIMPSSFEIITTKTGVEFKQKEEFTEEAIVQEFLAELSAAIEYEHNILEKQILQELINLVK